MALSALPITNFYYLNGLPVAGGEVKVHLNKDCTGPNGQVSAKIKSVITLDSNGAPENAPLFWPNAQLSPNDSVYILNVFGPNGNLIAGPIPVSVGPSASQTGFGVAFGSSFGS